MVLRLVQNMATGVYEYKEAQVAQKPVINTNAFEAYEGGEQTSLATGAGQTSDLGQQTESILQREAPGQLSFDAATGTIKEKDPKDAQIGVGKITDMTATAAQTGVTETPLEKAAIPAIPAPPAPDINEPLPNVPPCNAVIGGVPIDPIVPIPL